MSDEILHMIIKHYKGFTEDRIRALRKCFEIPSNVYLAKEIAEDLVKGLDRAGDYLLHPETFILIHNEKECMFCKDKGDEPCKPK